MRSLLILVIAFLAACDAVIPLRDDAPPPPSHGPTLLLPTRPSGSGSIEATPSTPLNVRGVFVYAAGDGSLWQQDAVTGDAAPLVERSPEFIAQMPAYSPDGKQVAYAALLFLPDGNVRGDIRTVNVDGTNTQTIVRAEKNDVVYWCPRYAPDGRLLVTRVENLQTTDERAQLEWANAGIVIEDARDGDVSRDGAHIAFVRYNAQTTSYALWVANADGTHQKELVAAGTFAAILNPRFSPDGQWIAFSVHGEPRQALPRASNADSCFLAILSACLIPTAHAHAARRCAPRARA